nr:CUB and sushi domain-containing protein 3 isoform X2 [Ciona intestinalis]|eukprot:XP_018668186.1 CUB and sushi domain-containing protein 3 isoform X2 [Ciona intestinalis]
MGIKFLLIVCVLGLFKDSVAQTPLFCYPPVSVAFALYTPLRASYPIGTTIIFTCRSGYTFAPSSGQSAVCERTNNAARVTWRIQNNQNTISCIPAGPGPVTAGPVTLPVIIPTASVAPAILSCGQCPLRSTCQQYNNAPICVCNDGYFNAYGICRERSDAVPAQCRAQGCPPNSDAYLLDGRYVHICKPTHFVYGSICAPRQVTPSITRCSIPAVGGNVIILAPVDKRFWNLGEVISYTCPSPMVATPADHRQATCMSSGLFSNPSPSCVMPATARTTTQAPVTQVNIRCVRPPIPVNGQVIATNNQVSWGVGQRVFVRCNPGYQLTGDNSFVCLSNGRWSQVVIICALPTRQPDVTAPCYSPIAPENGFVSPVGDFTWNAGDQVTYSCRPGYILTRPAVQTCQANGNFSSSPPECVRSTATCEPPPVPFYGSHDKQDMTVFAQGTRVTYTCNTGYTMFGTATIVCQAGGQYSSPAPTCIGSGVQTRPAVQPTVGIVQPTAIVITCPEPVPPQNGYISAGQKQVYFPGNFVTFDCRGPYVIQGNPQVICQGTGQFTPTNLVCILPRVPVTLPPVVPTVPFRTLVRVTTNPPPVVNVVTCTNPPVPAFGVSSSATYQVGSAFTYQCQPGYIVAGDTFTICQSNGQFETKITSCVLDVRPPSASCTPSPPPNGRIRPDGKTGYIPLDVITYECNSGYVGVGLPTAVCLSDGQWRADRFVCRPSLDRALIPNTCLASDITPDNAILVPPTKLIYNAYDTITVQCLPGFELVGDATGTCTEDGPHFVNLPPRCVQSLLGAAISAITG